MALRIFVFGLIFCLMLPLFMAWDHDLQESKKHNLIRRSADTNYYEIVEFWKQHKNEFNLRGELNDAVLVMGNTGAGKSTLILALLGRKLNAVFENGYFKIIDDENKIGKDSSSKTLIPEVFTDVQHNVTFIDCPGFRDNRDINHKISSIYFQNVLMNKVKNVKFIFVVSYDSLKDSGNKNDFDDLLEHIYKFLKNVPKYQNNISLVITKVANIQTYSSKTGLILLNNDEVVLNGIATFLINKKENYRNQREDLEKYKTLVSLIDVLLEKNNKTYRKIAVFRQPLETGPLSSMQKTNQELNTIFKMIQNIPYIKNNKNDVGFALSSSAIITITSKVDQLFNSSLSDRLRQIGNETLTHYLQLEKQYSDKQILSERISLAHKHISDIPRSNIDEPLQLFQAYVNAVNTLNISVSLTNLNMISDNVEALKFYNTLLNDNGNMRMDYLKHKSMKITDAIENLNTFYNFLNELLVNLATYKSQELKTDYRINSIINSCANSLCKGIKDIPFLDNISKTIGSDKMYNKINTLELNQFQLNHLKSVFEAFSTKMKIECPSSEQMLVKGYNIKLSDITKDACYGKSKNIQIFALNKVFIDSTIDKTGAEAQLYIIAPVWEVFGTQKIILDGKRGERHESAAKSAQFSSENGKDGLQGLPGGTAGNFFGVGREFINSELLEITANGGQGGPGQRGGDGADGIAGEELSEQFLKRVDEGIPAFASPGAILTLGYTYYLTRTTKPLYYAPGPMETDPVYEDMCDAEIYGKSAVKPTDGGNGGDAGIGGQPGSIKLYALENYDSVKKTNKQGPLGLPGQGGRGGNETSDGRKLKLRYQCLREMFFRNYDKLGWIDGAKIPAGKFGQPGKSISIPKYETNINPNPAINNFKNFVRSKLYKNIQEFTLRTFISKLDNNNRIKATYDTLFFVQELEGLENQSLDLRNTIDFVPFYEILLKRIEEFALNQASTQDKKVLNYVYTAALTKLFTLKKRSKGKNVVDLYRYLNTIETTVKAIRDTHYLQIVLNYQNDYSSSLYSKIQEAKHFIENKIEPEINSLWDESDSQIKSIMLEIQQNRHSTNDAITTLHKDKNKVYSMMATRAILLPFKLAATALSFIGPVGAMAGAAVTATTSIADGMLIDNTSGLGQNKMYSLDPNLKIMSRVTEVVNNKPQLLANKLFEVVENLDKHKDELSITQKEKIEISEKIGHLKSKVIEIQNRPVKSISQIDKRREDAKITEIELNDFINARKQLIEAETKTIGESKSERNNADKLKKEIKLEKSLRRVNNAQSILNGAEIVFSFVKKNQNDEGIISNINNQIAQYVGELKELEKLEDQVYKIIIPDLRQIEKTVNAIKLSVNGASHAKLDISKWTVHKTLSDVKVLLQKFTHKMSFEIQSNIKRCIDKIDEAFSILIDIYDRIDSYSDSVKQSEYIAHIVSTHMMYIEITDPKLKSAINNLNNIIQSNILFEKYDIALNAFKQHYFPFAAHVLHQFQLPTGMKLKDTETLRSNIVDKIVQMKNHIEESQATLGEYSKLAHEDNIFDSITSGSLPFYVWKHDTIKNEIKLLLSGSEILVKADISKGLNYNSVKYTDIGINLKLNDLNLQNYLNYVLKNFVLTMTLVGNNYYRCGERYYFVSFDDDITISYTLDKDKTKNWINPNSVYTAIRKNHSFLSPYGLWSIKLEAVNQRVTFDHLKRFMNETIDLELIGRGDYIVADPEFNFDICNEYLDSVYSVESVVKELK